MRHLRLDGLKENSLPVPINAALVIIADTSGALGCDATVGDELVQADGGKGGPEKGGG